MLEPAFHWARNDESIGFTKALVCSNCDHLKFYLGGKLIADARARPRTVRPFEIPAVLPPTWASSRSTNSGAICASTATFGGKQVISRNYSGRGIDQKFTLLPDDTSLVADGADTTRVVLRVTDEFDNIRPFASDPIVLDARRAGRAHRRQSFQRGGRHGSGLDPVPATGRNCAAHCPASAPRRTESKLHAHGCDTGESVAGGDF